MKIRLLAVVAFAVAILIPVPHTLALVDPAPSALPTQTWMAQIFVDDEGELTEFCKGALISERWIVTTGYCLFDPYEIFGPRRDSSNAEYVVRFGDSQTLHEIERFVQSSDLAIGMMKLQEPVTIAPVTISTKTAENLRNQAVFILGKDQTTAVGDAYFNPGFGKRMYCRLDGQQVFFGTGKLCYVMSKRISGTTLLETRAVVIDPEAPGAPNTTVDVVKPFDKTGARLYLDFRPDGSYPCHEDLGAPILHTNAAGQIELAGVVAGIGMTIGMPLCNPTLGNVFSAISHYQDFIDKTLTQGAFEDTCPASPKLEVEYLDGNQVRVHWNAVSGAQGYRLQYTHRVGYSAFSELDVGNMTEVRTEISTDFIYRVVIVAYNDICTSPLSKELAVAL